LLCVVLDDNTVETDVNIDQLVKKITILQLDYLIGAGTGWAGWASAHPGKKLGGRRPPWNRAQKKRNKNLPTLESTKLKKVE
jgi:hypothetical protein